MIWSLSTGWLRKLIMQHYSLVILMTTLLPIVTTNLTATETNAMTTKKDSDWQSDSIQQDVAFLEFLANMSEVNGKMTDPLDMIEMTDNDIFNTTATDTESIIETKLNNNMIMENTKPIDKTKAKENR